jgi:hypothetical protein
MPQGSLNTAVDRLIEDVSTKVLGKRKRMLKPDDNVTLDGGVDIFCNTFDMLRQGKWLYGPVCSGFSTSSVNLVAIPKRINTCSAPVCKSQGASQSLTSSRKSIIVGLKSSLLRGPTLSRRKQGVRRKQKCPARRLPHLFISSL